jgi:hypothetical protein
MKVSSAGEEFVQEIYQKARVGRIQIGNIRVSFSRHLGPVRQIPHRRRLPRVHWSAHSRRTLISSVSVSGFRESLRSTGSSSRRSNFPSFSARIDAIVCSTGNNCVISTTTITYCSNSLVHILIGCRSWCCIRLFRGYTTLITTHLAVNRNTELFELEQVLLLATSRAEDELIAQ